MGTQYNPNPNGASSAGWSLLNVTPSYTGDGVRLRKTASGIGGATQQFSVPGSGRVTLAGVQIMRNNSDPLPETIILGRNSGVTEALVNGADAWAPVGKWVTLPLVSTPSSTSGSVYISINSNAKYDVTIRRLYVYALGDADATSKAPDLDASDCTWTLSVPNNSLTVTATWNASPDEWVDTLEWKSSPGATPVVLDASITSNHKRTWTYANAGTIEPSLTVRNFSGDSYTVSKVSPVPSGTYQANFAYEADYLHVEVDGAKSVGAVIQKYSWAWGDGSFTNNQAVPYASHNYATPGTYFIQLTITNSMGQSSTKGLSVQVQSVPATPVDFTVARDKLTAVFTALTDGTTYGWTFGDGGTASTAQATHTYATAGTYTVVLTVDGLSISQAVTVTEDYEALDLVNSLRLEVKQDPGDVVPWNRIQNPSGATGAWGWTTPTSEFSGITAGPQGLRLQQAAGEALSASTESVVVPVLPGRYVTGSFRLVQVDAPCYVRARVYILDANLAEVAATTITAYQNAPGTYWTGPVKVPSSGRYATLGLLLYGAASPTFPPVGAGFTWREAQIASSLWASEVTNPPYSEAGTWADILGPTHQIAIDRAELDVSTLTATVLDAELDPAVAETIRPGSDVRLRAATERNGLRVWEPVYTGRMNAANVTYGQSNLEDPETITQELGLNPTLTTNTNTYEVVDVARFALAPTVDGGQVTLTGYGTGNTYYYACTLKVPVKPGRAYRIRLKARRVSGGWSESFRMYLRAFNSLDQDIGDARADRYNPPGSGIRTVVNDVAWNITDPTAGVWKDNEILVRPEYLPEGASTMNLWFCPVGNGTTSPNGVYTFTDVSVVEEWTPPARPKLRKSTRITLQAYDAAAKLAGLTQPTAVATLQELPSLMEESGVPVTIDGTGNTGPDPTVGAVNGNASLLDAVVAARDTQRGYAHVSRAGVLVLRTPQAVPSVPSAILDEGAYADADVTFDTEDAVNSLTVKWQRWDPSAGEAGETVETVYGPYEDLESIRDWGLHPEEVTWVGQVENVPAINAQALALIADNSTPERRVHSLALPIRYASDLTPARALLDLMDLVRVQHARTGIDQLLRLTEVHHVITARNGRTPALWTMEVGFSVQGSAARPVPLPALPSRSLTDGAWIPLTLGSGWADYNAAGGTYAPCAYQVTVKSNGRRQVTLRGLARTAAARTATSVVVSVPDELGPEYNKIYAMATSSTTTSGASSAASTGAASTGTAHTHVMPHTHSIATVGSRVDVSKTGDVTLTTSATLPIAAGGFVSLDDMSWEVKPA